MMTLAEIRDWLKTLDVAENYYIGRLDNKKEKSLGVYSRPGSGQPVMALGGIDCSSYDIKRISLLLHWNRNARETEEAARALWDAIFCVTNVDIVTPPATGGSGNTAPAEGNIATSTESPEETEDAEVAGEPEDNEAAETEPQQDPAGEVPGSSGTVLAHIQYIQPNVPEPVAVGTDDGGIYEYVIEMSIYYRR